VTLSARQLATNAAVSQNGATPIISARSVQPATDQDHSIAQPRDRVCAPRAGHRATRNCYSAYLHLQSPLFDI
jgi:hypothetical protein